MVVQLINDDGPESPVLEPFIDGLLSCSWVKELRVVIPSTDRSWIGSALSRKGKVSVKAKRISKCDALLVDGTPADCANLGIYSLYSTRPDLVLSGPNLGQNAGGPFTIASGTLGGALMAFLTGTRAIAISSELTPEIWDEFLGNTDSSEFKDRTVQWQKIASTSVNIIERSLQAEIHNLGAVININLPWGADPSSEIVVTKIQGGTMPSFFARGGDGTYHHHFTFPEFDSNFTCPVDHDCLVQKKISISMLKPMHATLDFSKETEQEILIKLNEKK